MLFVDQTMQPFEFEIVNNNLVITKVGIRFPGIRSQWIIFALSEKLNSWTSKAALMICNGFNEELHTISTSHINRINKKRIEQKLFHIRDVIFVFSGGNQIVKSVSGIASSNNSHRTMPSSMQSCRWRPWTIMQQNPTEFPINSYVLVHYRSGSPPTRLHTAWRGPMRVVSGSYSRYILYDLITTREKEYHVSNMKQFLYDPLLVDPVDVARRDRMEFFVESIVVLYCTYSTYVPYSLSPYRVLNSDTASALTLLSRHIVISPLSS